MSAHHLAHATAPEVVLPAPPPMPEDDQSSGAWTAALPMLGGLGSVAMMTGVGGGAAQGARAYLVGGLFLLSTCAMVAVQLLRHRGQRVRRVHDQRRSYLHLVARSRTLVRATADRQRQDAAESYPSVHDLLHRTPGEGSAPRDAVAQLRVGVGRTALAARIEVTAAPSGVVVDPVCVQAAQRFVTTHDHLDSMPVVVPSGAEVVLAGSPDACLAVARAFVAQAAGTHHPRALAVAVLTPRVRRVDWEWAKWLPHAGSTSVAPQARDALGALRLVGDDAPALGRLLDEEARHRLLVVDGVPVPRWARGAGTTVLALRTPVEARSTTAIRLDVDQGLLHVAGQRVSCRPDTCALTTAEALARRVCAGRLVGTPGDAATDRAGHPAGTAAGAAATRDFLALVGADSPEALPPRHSRPAHSRMAAPLGHTADGAPVHLDLKEAAEGGHGPHGLVVGATGSGKSELLRTLVLGLVATHDPDDLALVLVDFKGGATFAEFEHLPHVAGFVTNLADDTALVERMQDALTGELVRRQELLRATGHASLADHRAARSAGTPLAPIPSLFVCVDEFSELLSARPELVDLFVAFGRLGRSLGIHLLLATQRLEEGRLRGLESHLSYRVALRTFSASESRTAIGVPDAHTLPAGPGAGLLRTGPDELVRFSAAYVSGPWHPLAPVAPPTGGRVLPFTVTPVEVAEPARSSPVDAPASATEARAGAPATPSASLLTRVVTAAGDGRRTHQVWQPPLDHPFALGTLLDDTVVHPHLGLHSPSGRAASGLVLPIGLVDRPRLQRRDPLLLDLRGADGHVAVVGGPRSGRSTTLQTYVASLALSSTPVEAQVHLLDLAGGALAALSGLPHVVSHARRGDDDLVRRVVDEVCDLLDRREHWFREHGIDSVDQYRAQVKAGGANDGSGEVHLVVDGWGALRQDHEECEVRLTRLATRALSLGVHLVMASNRWSDLRPSLRDLVGSRVELRLTDAYDSEVDRRAAGDVPASLPGRGLVAGPEHVRVALPHVGPRLDAGTDPGSVRQGLDALVAEVARSWTGPLPRRLRPLPTRVDLRQLGDPAADPALLLLALEERTQAPLRVDLHRTPHLVVQGDEGSGRTQTLRTYLTALRRARTPAQAQVVLIDQRRELAGVLDESYLLAYATTAAETAPLLQEVAALLWRRTSADPPGRPEVFVVVDDAELVTHHGTSALDPVEPLLPHARDLGLRVVLARRDRPQHLSPDRLARTLDDLVPPVLSLSATVPGRGTWTQGRARPRTVQVAVTGEEDER